MRILNELEQKLCRKILELNEAKNNAPDSFLNLTTVVSDFLGNVKIVINRDDKSIIIKKPGGLINGVLHVNMRGNDSVIRTLVVAINLLTLLEKEAYISLFHIIPPQPIVTFGSWIEVAELSSGPMYDMPLKEKIIDYATKEIIISDEFIKFCNAGFIARDEQRFTQQIEKATTSAHNSSISAQNSARSARNSTVGLYISTTALLLSLYVNFNKSKEARIFTIEQKQIDSLVLHLNLINKNIDSLKLKTNLEVISNNSAEPKHKK